MPDQRKITWHLDAKGGKAAAVEMGSVTKQMEQMDAKSRAAATRFTGVASASSALGTSLSRVTPMIGGMSTAFGSAGGAVWAVCGGLPFLKKSDWVSLINGLFVLFALRASMVWACIRPARFSRHQRTTIRSANMDSMGLSGARLLRSWVR